MSDIESWKIWIFLGGIPTIISALFGALWFFVSKKILINWNSKKEMRLEEFKHELVQNTTLINSLLSNQTNTYLAAQEKRLLAVEKIWQASLNLRSSFPGAIVLMYDILTPDEIKDVLNDFGPNKIIPNQIRLFSAKDYTNSLVQDSSDLDQYRIYVDNKIWICLHVLRAFCGRLAMWVDKCKTNGEIRPWQEDNSIKVVLNWLFTEKQLDDIYKKQSLQYCFDSIEFMLYSEISELTTGKKSSDLYLDQYSKLNEIIKNVN